MILLIDNYDSFTYNLYQYFRRLSEEVVVKRNDEVDTVLVATMNPKLIVISPGPGRPSDTGACKEIVQEFGSRIPVLGICLGMQTIAECFGGEIIEANDPMHGKVRPISHLGENLFAGMASPMKVTRYHSLVVSKNSLPEDLKVDAESEEGEIMALSHRELPLWGVQFHPEALLTENGIDILANAILLASQFGGDS